MVRIDTLTRQAMQHTQHCLIGCGIGEVLGSAVGAGLQWPNLWQTVLATALAFLFGYSLTFWGARRTGMGNGQAGSLALRTDTISIVSMELVDNAFIWVVPSAINAAVSSWLFWWSMVVSLAVAFAVTVPVNRFVLARSGTEHGPTHDHMHHH